MAWLLVQTKPRRELEACNNLSNQGVELFLPLIRERKRKGTRLTWVTGPLFPCYLFISVQLNSDNISIVRSTRGVVNIVRFGKSIVPVDSEVIDFLKSEQDEDLGGKLKVEKPFNVGDELFIAGGPFAGLKGIFKVERGMRRVEVLLSVLGRETVTVLDRDQLYNGG